jgi:aminoglycoside phosphotransferase (APT) family kinase protein
MFLRTSAASLLTEACCASYDTRVLPPRDDCILHGDFWSSNVMFDTANGDASLIDFQFCRFGQPAVDLAVLLCTSTSAETRRGDTLEMLIQHYLVSYQHHSGSSDIVLTLESYTAALAHALHLIVLSYETWTTNFDAEILLNRFAGVVEDLATSVAIERIEKTSQE